ncbi:uncharacterized protein FTOL_13319 [Fusarium torulosum]|uniref:Zn(2)-C6 fungal-type domain-containing protein n=1 Tax=Fusarium torulosum TaxID=33205 RepID=A0AAE8SPT2_9HYPO|nr:uncharacterized protein FTOL_13319 [Fusarium torulosum]
MLSRVNYADASLSCGTCRKKSRKCDRKRPICDRCRTKGLHCEGYPPRFQFREVLVAQSRQPSTGVASSSDPLPLAELALEPPTVPQTTNAVTPPVDFSVIESFENCLPDSVEDLLPQNPSSPSHSSPLSPENTQVSANQASYGSPPIVNPQLQNEVIANQPIIEYFQQTLSQRLMIQVHGIENPFQNCVRDHGSLSLHTLVGCPPSLFYEIGRVLEAGKANLAGDLSLEQFKEVLKKAERFFRTWDPEQVVYPTSHDEWKHLADAYRHACLLRIMRFPDPLALSCEDTRIKASYFLQATVVSAISGWGRHMLAAPDTLCQLVY